MPNWETGEIFFHLLSSDVSHTATELDIIDERRHLGRHAIGVTGIHLIAVHAVMYDLRHTAHPCRHLWFVVGSCLLFDETQRFLPARRNHDDVRGMVDFFHFFHIPDVTCLFFFFVAVVVLLCVVLG